MSFDTISQEDAMDKLYESTHAAAKKLVRAYPLRFSISYTFTHKIKDFVFNDSKENKTYYISPIDESSFGNNTKIASDSLHICNLADDIADKWNTRFLKLAQTVAGYSKDPSTKVGAVIVDDDDNVRTIGYNGFPRGVKDTEERLNDRSIKYPLTVHAELNAICTCARVGVPTKGATMVCTHFPCADCAGAIVQAGFKEVVVLAPSEDFDSRWNETNNHARTIFTEGKVDVIVFTEDELE